MGLTGSKQEESSGDQEYTTSNSFVPAGRRSRDSRRSLRREQLQKSCKRKTSGAVATSDASFASNAERSSTNADGGVVSGANNTTSPSSSPQRRRTSRTRIESPHAAGAPSAAVLVPENRTPPTSSHEHSSTRVVVEESNSNASYAVKTEDGVAGGDVAHHQEQRTEVEFSDDLEVLFDPEASVSEYRRLLLGSSGVPSDGSTSLGLGGAPRLSTAKTKFHTSFQGNAGAEYLEPVDRAKVLKSHMGRMEYFKRLPDVDRRLSDIRLRRTESSPPYDTSSILEMPDTEEDAAAQGESERLEAEEILKETLLRHLDIEDELGEHLGREEEDGFCYESFREESVNFAGVESPTLKQHRQDLAAAMSNQGQDEVAQRENVIPSNDGSAAINNLPKERFGHSSLDPVLGTEKRRSSGESSLNRRKEEVQSLLSAVEDNPSLAYVKTSGTTSGKRHIQDSVDLTLLRKRQRTLNVSAASSPCIS
ncbi:unnamed protein product [Amoebophrya sp. A25]|nr:unnamed protein product [Amoebophrya sp. A25]|eukprot:GSA25T00018952001.1